MRTGVLFHPVSECGANVFKVENKTWKSFQILKRQV
jgi:hypothetical protein